MDAQQHVARLFLRDLGRQPDAAGQAFWEQRAKEVPPAQLNVEFREAAKTENPQAGQPRGSGMGTDPFSTIALPGEAGYTPDRKTNFFQALAPFIVPIIGAVAPALLPAIGTALGATGTAAAAVGAGVVNAGVTAAAGGSTSDILRAGVAAGAGTYAGTMAGQAVQGAQQAGNLSGTIGGSAALPAAAAGAVGSGTGALIQTGDVGQAALAALGGGAGQAAGYGALDLVPEGTNRTLASGISSAIGGATEAGITGQDIGSSALLSAATGAGQDYLAEQKARTQTSALPPGQQLANVEDLIMQAYSDPTSKVEVAGMAMPAGGSALANAVEGNIVRNMVTQLPQSVLDKIVANSSTLQNVLSATERQAGTALERIISSAEGRAQLLKDVIANTPEFAQKYGNEATIKSLQDAGASTAARTMAGAAALLTPGNIGQQTNEEAELAARRLGDPNFNPVEVLPEVTVTASPFEWGADLIKTGVVPKTGGAASPSNQQDAIQSLYDRYLNREAEQAGRDFWTQRATEVSPDQLQREFEEAARREATATQTQTGTQTQPRTQTQTQTQTGTQTGTGTPTRVPTGTGGGGSGGTTGGGVAGGGSTSTLTDQDREIINLTGIADDTGPFQEDQVDQTDEGGADETAGTDTGAATETRTPIRRKKKKPKGTVAVETVPLTTLLGAAFPMMPGASALAQALNVGDPGGSYMDKKGRERKPVWNVESLKLSDELGGTGYD